MAPQHSAVIVTATRQQGAVATASKAKRKKATQERAKEPATEAEDESGKASGSAAKQEVKEKRKKATQERAKEPATEAEDESGKASGSAAKQEVKAKRKKATQERAKDPAKEAEEEKNGKASGSATKKEEALMLVDGYSCLYAAYYATVRYGLQNERGEPTGAILGFVNMIRNLRRELPTTHFAVMLDSPGASKSRKKAEAPDEFKHQVAKAKGLCEAFGLSYREEDGYEADDLIHTYATSASEDMRVRIISHDKNLAQLVGPNVVLHRNTKELSVEMDMQAVEKKFGVRPDQMTDFLAMSGHDSDCIPGLPGIGSVGAVKLLQRHQTLEGVIEAAEADVPLPKRMPKKINAILVENQEQARMMREVVALRTVSDLIKPNFLDDFRTHEMDEKQLQRALAFCEAENMTTVAASLKIEHSKEVNVA